MSSNAHQPPRPKALLQRAGEELVQRSAHGGAHFNPRAWEAGEGGAL